MVIPEGYFCQLRYRQLQEGERHPEPYPNAILVDPKPSQTQGAPEQRSPRKPTKSADQDMAEWERFYGSGLIQHNQATSGNNFEAMVQTQITEIMRNQYGFAPKQGAINYAKPYLEVYDLLEAPPKFKIPDFSKFSGNEGASTIEHVSRYLAQHGIAFRAEHMKIRLFSLSLAGPAFGWYTTLPLGSITTWKQLEEKFHAQFFSGTNEATISDLTEVRQQPGESVYQYIQRFREIRNICFSLQLPEKALAELAFKGLNKVFKIAYGPNDLESVGHLVSKVAAYERSHP